MAGLHPQFPVSIVAEENVVVIRAVHLEVLDGGSVCPLLVDEQQAASEIVADHVAEHDSQARGDLRDQRLSVAEEDQSGIITITITIKIIILIIM